MHTVRYNRLFASTPIGSDQALSPEPLLVITFIGVVLVVVLITWLRMAAFIALAAGSLFVGLAARMPPADIPRAFQQGVGDTLGFTAMVIGLGTVIGKLLAESGGAVVVSRALVRAMGERRVDWALMLSAFVVGLPIGIWALWVWYDGTSPLPLYLIALAISTIVLYCVSMSITYASTWRRTAIVLDRRADRLQYMLRVNPVFLWAYWLWWSIPIAVGTSMYLRDGGRVWERTEKVDAIHELVRDVVNREE